MKRIYSILSLFLAGILFISCEDQADDFFSGNAPDGVAEEVGTILVPLAFSYEYGNTPEVNFPIEVVGNIEDYTVYIQLATASGNSEVAVLAQGSASANYTFTNDELFALTPVNGVVFNDDSLVLGDAFRFSFEVNLPGFDRPSSLGSKNFSASFACPLEADFTGEYLIEDVTGSGLVGSLFGEGTVVEVTANGPFERQFEAVYGLDLAIGNTALPFVFELLCGQVIVADGQNSGLQCSAGIEFGEATENSTFDAEDDSSFELTLSEDITNDCGAGVLQTTVRLTKVGE